MEIPSRDLLINQDAWAAFGEPGWTGLSKLCTRAATCPIKRASDVIGAFLLLVLLAPMMAIVAILIRTTSAGPALFFQTRSGLNGRPFRIAKFRTMHVLEDGPNLDHARRNDARVTRFGAFLRRSSLDELPQLLNILKGEMSFVGPRPHAACHDDYYGRHLPGYSLRFAVRPGLTGLAQIGGLRGEIGNLVDMADRVAADRRYIEQWTLDLDLFILIMTIPRLVSDRTAY